MSKLYNPLDKLNLAKSIQIELLRRLPEALTRTLSIQGAGVYAIYYTGAFPAYAPIAKLNRDGNFESPIYVGKAIPKGGRKGGFRATSASASGKALADRLAHHASSIDQASNLRLEDFSFRHLVVDDVWIPLGENMLIETFKPVWNRAVDGFGNKDPGQRRKAQYKSPWDVLHPGRDFSIKLADGPLDFDFVARRVADYLAGKPLAKLPKVIEDQQAEEQAEAEESADEV